MLANDPDRDVAVTVVWFNMVRTYARDRWPRDEIVDRRSRHYWDSGKLVGTALAGRPELAAWRPVAWDVWLLYPAGTTWETAGPGAGGSWPDDDQDTNRARRGHSGAAGRTMTIPDSGSDVLASLPHLPRWVDARGMLLARRGFVVDTTDGCRPDLRTQGPPSSGPPTVELSPQVAATATREVPACSILLQDADAAGRPVRTSPTCTAEPADGFTLHPERARGYRRLPQWPTWPRLTAC